MRRAITVVALAALCSCSTLVNGTTGHIRLSTTPSGAEVFLGDYKVGETPCVVSMRHDEPEWLSFSHPEIERVRYAKAERSPSGWLVLSFLTGAIVFPVIDGATGAAAPLAEAMHVDLEQAATETAEDRRARLREEWTNSSSWNPGQRHDELPWN